MPLLYRGAAVTSKKSVISQSVNDQASRERKVALEGFHRWRRMLQFRCTPRAVTRKAIMSNTEVQIAELTRGTDEVLPENGLEGKLK